MDFLQWNEKVEEYNVFQSVSVGSLIYLAMHR